MKFVSLASGSSGNCTLLATEKTKLLVDCGISARKADEALKSLGCSLKDIDAVFVTHEHIDHIRGLKRLMSAYGIPIYATGGTLRNLSRVARDEFFSYAGREHMEEIQIGKTVEVGDVSILPFRTFHDVAEPCGYRFEIHQNGENQRKFVQCAVMTDCGHVDDNIADHLMQMDALLLEANHDRGMLANGPYPMTLKRRIMSGEGHLSNNSSGQLLAEILSPRLKAVLLGHLSRENNTYELALNTVKSELARAVGPQAAAQADISIAPQDAVSKLIEL